MNGRELQILGYTIPVHGLIHTYMLLIPLLIPQWMAEFSVDEAGIGLVATAAYFLFGVGAIPSGFAADKLGSSRVISLSIGGSGLALVLTFFTRDIFTLTLSLLLLGILAGLYHPAGLSLLSREMTETGKGFGYHGTGGNVGIAAGPFIGAVLLNWFPWREVLLLSAVPGVLLGGMGLLIRRDLHSSDVLPDGGEGVGQVRRLTRLLTVPFLLVLSIYFLYGFYYRGSVTFIPTFIDKTFSFPPLNVLGRALTAGRYLFVAMLLVGALGQTVAGHLADREGAETVLAGTFVSTTVALALLPMVSGLPFIASLLVFGFFLFAVQPLANSLVAKVSGGAVRGLAYGLTFLSSFGFGSFGAALAGFLAASVGYLTVYLTLAITSAAALVTLLLLTSRQEDS